MALQISVHLAADRLSTDGDRASGVGARQLIVRAS
jgi:hypothetical protein